MIDLNNRLLLCYDDNNTGHAIKNKINPKPTITSCSVDYHFEAPNDGKSAEDHQVIKLGKFKQESTGQKKRRGRKRRKRQISNRSNLVTRNGELNYESSNRSPDVASRNHNRHEAAQDQSQQQFVSTSLPLQAPLLKTPVQLLLAAAAAGQYPLPLLSPLAQTLNETASAPVSTVGHHLSAGSLLSSHQNHFTSLSPDARACVTATYLCVLIVNNTWLDCNLLETLCRNNTGALPLTHIGNPFLALKPLNASASSSFESHAGGKFARKHNLPHELDELGTAMLALSSSKTMRDEEDEGGGHRMHNTAISQEPVAMSSDQYVAGGYASKQDELSVAMPIKLDLPWQPGDRMLSRDLGDEGGGATKLEISPSSSEADRQQTASSLLPETNSFSSAQMLDKLSLYSQIVSLIGNENLVNDRNLVSANRMQHVDSEKMGRLVDEADSNSILEQYFKFRKFKHNYPKTRHRERDVTTTTTITTNTGQTLGENLGNINVDNIEQNNNSDNNKSLVVPTQVGSSSLTQWMIRSFRGLGSYNFWPIYGSTNVPPSTDANQNVKQLQELIQPTLSGLNDNGDADGYTQSTLIKPEHMNQNNNQQQQNLFAQFLRSMAGERNGYQQFNNDITLNQSHNSDSNGMPVEFDRRTNNHHKHNLDHRQQESSINSQSNPLGRGDDDNENEDPSLNIGSNPNEGNTFDGSSILSMSVEVNDKRQNSRVQQQSQNKQGFSLFTVTSQDGKESIVPVEIDPRQLVEQSSGGGGSGESYDQNRRLLNRFAQEHTNGFVGRDHQIMSNEQCVCNDRILPIDQVSLNDHCRLRCNISPTRLTEMGSPIVSPSTTMLMTAATDATPSSLVTSTSSVLVPTGSSPIASTIGQSAKMSPLDVTYLLYTRYHRDLVQEIAHLTASTAAAAATAASVATSPTAISTSTINPNNVGVTVSSSASSVSAPALVISSISTKSINGANLASQLISENLIKLGDIIDLNNETTLNESHFNSSLPVKIIIHGFGSGGRRPWVTDMVYKLLEYENVNVIVVDWEKGATLPNYVQAAGNTRLVGHKIATLIQKINLKYGLTGDSYHLIGFSLGAHVAGFAGMEIRNTTTVLGGWINRITGLDPASPLFEGYEANDRLDPSDAQFVDVIHSNGDGVLRGGFGSLQPMGHVDFYPNGGRVQVGCNSLLVSALSDIIYGRWQSLCNHRRALNFFMDSFEFNQCRFRSFNCDSYESYLKGECFDCGRDNEKCSYMGYLANYSKGRGKMYLTTHEEAPFCANQFIIKIIGTKGYRSHWGKVEVTLLTLDGKNETFLLSSMSSQPISQSFEGAISGSKEMLQHSMQSLIVAHPNLSNFTRVLLRYNRYKGWIYSGDENWPIDKVFIADSEGQVKSYCGFNTVLESHITTRLDLEPGNCTVLEPTSVGGSVLASSATIQSLTTPAIGGRTLAPNAVSLLSSSQVSSSPSTPTPPKSQQLQTVSLQVSSMSSIQRQQPTLLIAHHYQQQQQQQQQQPQMTQQQINSPDQQQLKHPHIHTQQISQSARTPRLLAALIQTAVNDVSTSSTLGSPHLRR